MTPLEWAQDHPTQSNKILFRCSLAAFFIEVVLLTSIGWHEHWISHSSIDTSQDDNRFVSADVFRIAETPHLVEEKKQPPARPQGPEPVLSRTPGRGVHQKTPATLETENRTETGPKIPPNHGPVAIYAPAPVIPTYLQNRAFTTSVVIDFYVTMQGNASPRLVGSSGDEELDAIALNTVKTWHFRPAERDHKPVDEKIRLRIVFEVK